VDISLLDGSVSWLTYLASGYLASGDVPQRYGSAHPTIAPYQAFATSDGFVMLAVGNDALWKRFTGAIGRPDLTGDPRFSTNPLRVTNREELIPLLKETLLKATTQEWINCFDAAGVPAGPIQTVDQALKDPQVIARGMITELEHPEAGALKVIGCPIKLNRTPAAVRTPPPLLGQHTLEVLQSAGYTDTLIKEMQLSGAIQ
jgi:formyl-CoA transferase/CoA:oxalate CoA-transferase